MLLDTREATLVTHLTKKLEEKLLRRAFPHCTRGKFHRGDIVEIKRMPETMSHFPTGIAVVLYNYRDKYGYGCREQYGLDFGEGLVSWYPGHLLKLVKRYRGRR